MALTLKPLGSRIVVEPIEQEDKTVTGIYLPDTAKEKPMKGTIVAIGEGERDEAGKRIPMEVKVGDVVLFNKYSGTEVKIDDKKILVMKESDILAIIEG